MEKDTSTEDVESDPNIEQIRTLILGKENHLVTESIKKEARDIVTDVFTEALHDRQHSDGSVNKVLQPIIEDSVQQSVTHNSGRLVSSLYPLVGSLVRKSVSAFLTDFMEKTNQLLESSLTFKGLKWRINAWQAGVSFAQYAASQTFVYRVEHVFLIHRETGLLLSSVELNNTGQSDADLISAMLTAINDFVGDSFLANEDGLKEQLQSVSTDNFNLLIKPGPSALVVAAVIGQPPQKLNDQLQVILEDIHRLYVEELRDFNGENKHFENSSNLLRDCLLSEQKTVKSKKSTPWFAWCLLFIATIYCCYQAINWFQNDQLSTKIMQLDHQPGIIVNKVEVINNNEINLYVLRDPDAVEVGDWLKGNKLDITQLNITERSYYSFEPDILRIRAKQILTQYPTIEPRWKNNTLNLSGTLELLSTEKLLNKLSIAGLVEGKNLEVEQLKLTSPHSLTSNSAVKKQLFDDLVGRISAIQIDFTVASETITPKMQISLQRLYLKIQQLNKLAEELDISFGLLIMGTSDSSGIKEANSLLSLKRAENTAKSLEIIGFSKENMYVTGLGQIDISDIKNTSRKVMFNIIYVSE
jgi:outer membrane protein OmpA-like peptidoglycan-associated protein